jgi:hypothetical protein
MAIASALIFFLEGVETGPVVNDGLLDDSDRIVALGLQLEQLSGEDGDRRRGEGFAFGGSEFCEVAPEGKWHEPINAGRHR